MQEGLCSAGAMAQYRYNDPAFFYPNNVIWFGPGSMTHVLYRGVIEKQQQQQQQHTKPLPAPGLSLSTIVVTFLGPEPPPCSISLFWVPLPSPIRPVLRRNNQHTVVIDSSSWRPYRIGTHDTWRSIPSVGRGHLSSPVVFSLRKPATVTAVERVLVIYPLGKGSVASPPESPNVPAFAM